MINKTEQIIFNLNENVNSGSDNMMASVAATRILMVKMGRRTRRHRKFIISTLLQANIFCTGKVPLSVHTVIEKMLINVGIFFLLQVLLIVEQ